MTVEWRFTADDVARLRFAFSPLWELVMSLRVLRAPSRHSLHLPWLRAVRPRLGDLDLRELFALVPLSGYIPDFLTPPPETPVPGVAAELERVRTTPPEVVREELSWVRSDDPRTLERFLEDPAAGVRRVADRMLEYWTAALEEFWPRVQALLDADVLWRARRLAAGGVRELFADLHPSVSWHGDRLVAVKAYQYTGEIRGEGLVLVPSVFGWPGVYVMHEPYRPMLCYPARGVGTLWSEGGHCVPGALAALIGRTRAQILTALGEPGSATGIARLFGLTPGAVSQHLTVLFDCGLVSRQRLGRQVLYRRTPLGDSLIYGA
ncbi:transcriptional regulator [Thermobispora bispora]|jgi:hypothetical protein|nr:DUF5937 family protein [Thermobispora bispora]MBO2474243.1 transcriptional regulator [Actinomycetales bacterium]MBX6168928.1 helix-turn-helix domain-containing protein [Thermobispora bispora]QSI47845.1 ArsR family transcriptional regulator [Thermobispora bispora]